MCIYFLYKYIQLYVGLYIKCVVRVCIVYTDIKFMYR